MKELRKKQLNISHETKKGERDVIVCKRPDGGFTVNVISQLHENEGVRHLMASFDPKKVTDCINEKIKQYFDMFGRG